MKLCFPGPRWVRHMHDYIARLRVIKGKLLQELFAYETRPGDTKGVKVFYSPMP